MVVPAMPPSPPVVPTAVRPPEPGEVVVVWAPPGPVAAVSAVLDPVEQSRLSAFARSADRDRYATAAALVRVLVGRAIGVTPAAVPVDRTCRTCGAGHGRPRVTAPLAVSVTHAGARVGVAVAQGPTAVLDGAGVGIDVSAPTERSTVVSVASSILAPTERAWAADDPDALVRLWTAKEAVLKAAGVGLSVDPAAVELSPSSFVRSSASVPDLRTELELVGWPLAVEPASVHVVGLAPGDGHVGALAWIGPEAPRLREERVTSG
jgi:4'-phosphopantetheinyl transferase